MTDEAKRLAALEAYEIMDMPSEQAFDDLTKLTTFICGTPIALVTLLDSRRQWFKSSVGLEARETPIEQAFCTYAIEGEGVFTVSDATQDQRFAANVLVTGDPHIRFYAGAPLITPEGIALGTLCAIDRVPRRLSPEQEEALQALARQVIWTLELRKKLKELTLAVKAKEEAEQEARATRTPAHVCVVQPRARRRKVLEQGRGLFLKPYRHPILPRRLPRLRRQNARRNASQTRRASVSCSCLGERILFLLRPVCLQTLLVTLKIESRIIPMSHPEFSPGFRLSTFDALLLVIGAFGAWFTWSRTWWLGFVIAFVVGHFFLFCNVFRISRSLEFIWAAIFLILTRFTIATGQPNWTTTSMLTITLTVFLICIELRKPSYHGIGWNFFNPDLRKWWDAQHTQQPE